MKTDTKGKLILAIFVVFLWSLMFWGIYLYRNELHLFETEQVKVIK
jgi:hypothetical protein